MNQPHNNNGANGADPQPVTPRLDDATFERMAAMVESLMADYRQQLEEIYIREIRIMGEESRALIRAAIEQAGVTGFRERLLWMTIGAMSAIIGFSIGSWLRLPGSF